VLRAARAELATEPAVGVDYCEVVAADTFEPVGDDFTGSAILIVAGSIGGVRLLDNLPIVL
jgi:pantoate--beta-alanine ligase